MKTAITAALLSLIASASAAFTTSNCYWVGTVYTCSTYGGGTMTTTRCYTIGNTVHCTQY